MPHWWEDYGSWAVDEQVNGRPVGNHPVTPWPQSGSEPRSVVPSGSQWFIWVVHIFFYIEIFWVPAPECLFLFCYDPIPVLLPAITSSSLTCRVP
jgi:hypothetical protein